MTTTERLKAILDKRENFMLPVYCDVCGYKEVGPITLISFRAYQAEVLSNTNADKQALVNKYFSSLSLADRELIIFGQCPAHRRDNK